MHFLSGQVRKRPVCAAPGDFRFPSALMSCLLFSCHWQASKHFCNTNFVMYVECCAWKLPYSRGLRYFWSSRYITLRPTGGGGGVWIPPEDFLHSYSDNSSATFLKVTPPPKNLTIASRPHWLRERFETFRIWYTTKYLQLVYLRFFLYRWPKVRSISWPKGEALKCLKYWSDMFKSFRTMLS